MKRPLCAAAFSIVVLSGCGGGGAGSEASSPDPIAEAEFAFGPLRGRAASTNPPITSNSSSIVATGLVGLVTSLRLQDQAIDPSETRIAFTSPMHSTTNRNDIYTVNLDGTDLVRVTNTPGLNELDPEVSPDGKRIAFSLPGSNGNLDLYVINIDGTGLEQITNNGVDDVTPSWSPNGTSLAYSDGNQDIRVVNVSTKVVTVVAAGGVGPVFSPDGQDVVFAKFNVLGDSRYHIHKAPATGGGPVSLVHSVAGASQTQPAYSPDGLFLSYFDLGANSLFYKPIGGVHTAGTAGAQHSAWSPDSQRVAYEKFFSSQTRIFTSNPDGSAETQLLPQIAAHKTSPSYVRPPRNVQFVGQGSLFGSRLAGFIFSQNGAAVKSLLGWDASTPLSSVLTKQTPNDTVSPNLVFSIDADTVIEISFAHAPYWQPVKVVGGGTSLLASDGALVSIDSETGKIVAVLPFQGVRSAKPSVSDEGGTRVFSGNFLGVFDGAGNTLAESGASEVRLDMSSGEISIGG